jgi:hypothetical protein
MASIAKMDAAMLVLQEREAPLAAGKGSDHLAARIGPPCSRERENLIAKRVNLGDDALFQGGPFDSGKKKCINVTQFEIQYAA